MARNRNEKARDFKNGEGEALDKRRAKLMKEEEFTYS